MVIIRDALIVTPRSDAPVGHLEVHLASIGVSQGTIQSIGPYEIVRRRCPACDTLIEGCPDGELRYIAMPGFVDAHSHSRQMALQAYWDSGWHQRHSRPQSEEEASDLFRWFLVEAIRGGVTFVCDWPEYPHLWDVGPLAAHLRAAGLRGCLRLLLPHNRGASLPTLVEQQHRVQTALRECDDTLQLGIWIPEEDKPEYGVTTLDLLGRLRKSIADCPVVFQMHLAESRKRKEADGRAVARLVQHGLLGPGRGARTVLVHAIWLDHEELLQLGELRDHVGVVTCPKFADGRVAPLKELIEAGVPVGLGSDVLVPDPLSLIRSLVALHKSREPGRHLSFGEAFHMATLGGAAVFGREKRIGSLEEGKDADIVLVRNPAPVDVQLFGEGRPWPQRVGAIARLFARNVVRREHIDKVFVRGRLIVDGGRCVAQGEEGEILAAGKRAARAILHRLSTKRD